MSETAKSVLSEIVALANDPSLTLEEVSSQLEEMHSRAEAVQDADGMALVVAVYDRVQTMSSQTGAAIDIAVAAREAARALQEQRDQALEEHQKLREAVENMDIGNEAVDRLIGDAEEMFYENLYMNDIYVTQDPAEDMISNGRISVEWAIADRFYDMLVGNSLDAVTPEIRQEIADFMVRIVGKAGGHEDQAE